MAALADAMKTGIWFDRPKVEEAEYKYQEYLVRKNSSNAAVMVVAGEKSGSNLSQQIQEVRQKMQDSLKDSAPSVTASDIVRKQVDELVKENERLKNEVAKMTNRFEAIEKRLSAIESGQTPAAPAEKKEPLQNGVKDEEDDDDDDDDIDLFGSSDEEENEEAERIKAERLKAYQEKKAKKPAVVAKSNIILDVKPWDDETDMNELEKCVRSIEMDGLLWGASKFVKIAFGIQKLQITCVVEDDKVSTDDLEERIVGFEDYIQSMDIAAFNKI